MAETKTTTPQTRNQTPLYIVCIALLVAVVLAIVGFVGKNTANQQNAELTAQLEELTATKADLEEQVTAMTAGLEGKDEEITKLNTLLDLGESGCRALMQAQREALGDAAALIAPKQKLILASNNAHKIQELSAMLGGRYDVLSMRDAGFTDEIIEDGETFEENARIKAEAVMRATGYLTLADDSGLSVDALGGAPGVHSARYAGDQHSDADNNALLMKNMENVPDEARTARFVSCIAIASPFKPTQIVRGECPGRITRAPRGSGTFGYDPYFEYENGLTFAEMEGEAKNAVSHRARAMQEALKLL